MCSAGEASATPVSANLTTVVEKENEGTSNDKVEPSGEVLMRSVDGGNGKKTDSVQLTTVRTMDSSKDRVVQVTIMFAI